MQTGEPDSARSVLEPGSQRRNGCFPQFCPAGAAGALQSMRGTGLHESLPYGRDLSDGRQNRQDRQGQVHRLQILHDGVPYGARYSVREWKSYFRRDFLSASMRSSASRRGRRKAVAACRQNAISVSTGALREKKQPACRRVRPKHGFSAISTILKARYPISSRQNAVSSCVLRSAPSPKSIICHRGSSF